MEWYKATNTILRQEPETWLTYLYGQQLGNIPHLTRSKPRYSGIWLQLAKFFFLLLGPLRFRQVGLTGGASVKFLVFAGTVNQKNALHETIVSLNHRKESIAAIAPAKLINSQTDHKYYFPITYSVMDVCNALILFVCRGPALYRELDKIHPVAVSGYFAKFCSAYVYLCYFYRILTQLRPEFVITSNDHNVSNRCMLAVAHQLNIKTVYLQHASVSNLFPALRVNYAFLDGQCALDIYRDCEQNQPHTNRKVPLPEVLLTGQKKHLIRSVNTQSSVIGFALNALDNADEAIKLVRTLAESGKEVRVRWHPTQARQDIKKYLTSFAEYQQVSLSNPRTEPVSEFMIQIGWLIAGNSSIHLEAALAGVKPIYYELTPPDTADYYGYVKHGLSKAVKTVAEVIRVIESTEDDYWRNVDAVRYYSSTYLTEWDGKEGELVAECLIRILYGERLPVEIVAFSKETDLIYRCSG